MFFRKKVANYNGKSLTVFIEQYIFMEVPKSLMKKKKVKRTSKLSAELNSAHRCSQAK